MKALQEWGFFGEKGMRMKYTMQQKTEMMGTGRIGSVFLVMLIPSVAAQISNNLYNLVNRFFMGQYVGSKALGAVSLTTPLINIMAGLSLLITIGGAALLSMDLGRGRLTEARKLFSNLIVQAVVTSFVLALIYFLFAPQIILLCGADESSSLYREAVLYLRILAFGLMFQLLNAVQASIIRAEGNAAYSLAVSIIGGFVNIGLDMVFVVWLGMGVAGAAYATVASQFISALASTAYFFGRRSQMKWMGFGSLDLKKNLEVVRAGMAPAVLQFLSFVTGVMLNNQLRIYGDLDSVTGDTAISAMSVVQTVESLFTGIVMGINQAVSPIVSYNYGAGSYQRVKQASLLAVATGTVISFLSWALMMFAPAELFGIFSSGEALIAYGAHAMRLYRAFAMVAGIQTLCSMYFSSIGQSRTATVMSVLKQGAFLIPLFFILPRFWGLDGVLAAMSVSDFLSTAVIALLYTKGIRELTRREKGRFNGEPKKQMA